ncbi:MAG: GAF domain-containing protein [Bacteroidetes bacterium]|nr:GAF domain-containing protein [Bacteroidota bacterium]
MLAFLTILAVLLASTLLWNFFRLRTLREKIVELDDKAGMVINSDESLMQVSFKKDTELSDLALHFNQLSRKYLEAKEKVSQLLEENIRQEDLDKKVTKYKEAISQIELLSVLGRRITGSLNVEEIIRTVFNTLRSSMEMESLDLLYFQDQNPIYGWMNSEQDWTTIKGKPDEEKEAILHWVISNGKEVHLKDARVDYRQYTNEPILTLSGDAPGYVLAFPMILKEKVIGALMISGKSGSGIKDYHVDFIRSLTSYMAVALDNCTVYHLLDEGKHQIEEEKSRSDKLLLNILPAEIAEELKNSGKAMARHFDNVHVLFTDFIGFTQLSASMEASELVDEINACFTAFDEIGKKYHLEKIKTIGDAYMTVAGLNPEEDSALENIILAAGEMQSFMAKRYTMRIKEGKKAFQMRAGIHSGPVTAGIVGSQKFQYDLWGDTVNTASRMESSSQAGEVNISNSTYLQVKDNPKFRFDPREAIEVKGKGKMDMYFVHILS